MKWRGTWLSVAVTGSMWQLQGICGSYRVYVAVTGSMWLLQGQCGSYRVYVAVTGSMWLLLCRLQDIKEWMIYYVMVTHFM